MKISERLKHFLRCRSNMHKALYSASVYLNASDSVAMEEQFFYLLAVDETNEAYKKLTLSDLSAFAALQGVLTGELLDWQIALRKTKT